MNESFNLDSDGTEHGSVREHGFYESANQSTLEEIFTGPKKSVNSIEKLN